MSKVQNFAGLTLSLPFTEYDFYASYRATFEKTELGRMHKLLPLHELAENLGLLNKSMKPKCGRKPYFTPEGKVALMILKMYTDATCYESEMRYPTDQKLLWECCRKAYAIMCEASQRLHVHRPRTKYLDVEKANMGYVKQRRHNRGQTKKMLRRLLALLEKILKELRKMERMDGGDKVLTDREKKLIDTITKVYRQQERHFASGDACESIPNRIVSIAKPYVRPIVRGKEVKSVEFGAKCNNIQVDGVSFIEKLSFNAFNEGTRLQHCIKMHKRMFRVDVKKIGGDTGYAGAANRNYCKEKGIQTSFVKRGRPSQEKKEKDFVRAELARVRATAMEGSFGTQKEHYDLRRVKARKKATETCTSSLVSIPQTWFIWQSG